MRRERGTSVQRLSRSYGGQFNLGSGRNGKELPKHWCETDGRAHLRSCASGRRCSAKSAEIAAVRTTSCRNTIAWHGEGHLRKKHHVDHRYGKRHRRAPAGRRATPSRGAGRKGSEKRRSFRIAGSAARGSCVGARENGR